MELYTIAEVAEKLKVHDATVRRLIHDNELDHIKVKGSYRIRQDQLTLYLMLTPDEELE